MWRGSARQFLRDRHAIRHISLIRGFRPRQQFGHFGLQLGLDLPGMFIGQRAVPAGIGVDLRAVQRHRAKLEQAHLARQYNFTSQPTRSSPALQRRMIRGLSPRRLRHHQFLPTRRQDQPQPGIA
jgi:hypothetical protein